jgi:hypothetical protein
VLPHELFERTSQNQLLNVVAEGKGIEPSPLPGRSFQDCMSTIDATLRVEFVGVIAHKDILLDDIAVVDVEL